MDTFAMLIGYTIIVTTSLASTVFVAWWMVDYFVKEACLTIEVATYLLKRRQRNRSKGITPRKNLKR